MSASESIPNDVRWARRQLPSAHRALLDELRVQDGFVDDWPAGVQDFYRTLRLPVPTDEQLASAAAVWLDALRIVAFNVPLLDAATQGIGPAQRREIVAAIAWHEYGHALSFTRANEAQRVRGPELLDLLSPGMRATIDYPGGYRRSELFDEIIAAVYTLLVNRVRNGEYRPPDSLHPEIFRVFTEVIPWPPSP